MAIGIAAVSLAYTIYSGNEQDKETSRANRLTAKSRAEQKLRGDISNLRSRRQAARDAIAARSGIRAQAANEGGVTSSATAGALSSVGTQAGSNISYLDTLGASQGRELAFNTQADAVFGRIQRLRNQNSMVQAGLRFAQNKDVRNLGGY